MKDLEKNGAVGEMESIENVTRRILNPDPGPENTVPCGYCGAKVLVDRPGEQWHIRCPACGQKIRLSRRYREFRGFVKRAEKKPACVYCDDTGIVQVPHQEDEQMVLCAYRCVCVAGQARREKGIPMAVDVDLAPVLRRRMGVVRHG